MSLAATLETVVGSDNGALTAFASVAAVSAVGWAVYQAQTQRQRHAAEEMIPAEPLDPKTSIAERSCSLKTYDYRSITNREVTKLMESEEFKTFWAANGARIRAQNRAALKGPFWVLAVLALGAIATAYVVPFNTTAGDASATLLERVAPVQAVRFLAEGIPMAEWFRSLDLFWALAPLLAFCLYVAAMLQDSVLGNVVSVLALAALLFLTGTATLSIGAGAVIFLTLLRLYR